MEKKALRKKYKEIRNSLEFLKCDVTDRVINCREYINADTVFSYISFNSEIDTEKINRRILEDKKILLVPYCVPGTNIMLPVRILKPEDLSIGSFGIMEPVNPIEYKGKIDLTIVPGLAFSKNGYRIGYGKGFYDRFLSKNITFSIGLTYDELLFENIPHNDLDVKVDKIITPGKEIIIR